MPTDTSQDWTWSASSSSWWSSVTSPQATRTPAQPPVGPAEAADSARAPSVKSEGSRFSQYMNSRRSSAEESILSHYSEAEAEKSIVPDSSIWSPAGLSENTSLSVSGAPVTTRRMSGSILSAIGSTTSSANSAAFLPPLPHPATAGAHRTNGSSVSGTSTSILGYSFAASALSSGVQTPVAGFAASGMAKSVSGGLTATSNPSSVWNVSGPLAGTASSVGDRSRSFSSENSDSPPSAAVFGAAGGTSGTAGPSGPSGPSGTSGNATSFLEKFASIVDQTESTDSGFRSTAPPGSEQNTYVGPVGSAFVPVQATERIELGVPTDGGGTTAGRTTSFSGSEVLQGFRTSAHSSFSGADNAGDDLAAFRRVVSGMAALTTDAGLGSEARRGSNTSSFLDRRLSIESGRTEDSYRTTHSLLSASHHGRSDMSRLARVALANESAIASPEPQYPKLASIPDAENSGKSQASTKFSKVLHDGGPAPFFPSGKLGGYGGNGIGFGGLGGFNGFGGVGPGGPGVPGGLGGAAGPGGPLAVPPFMPNPAQVPVGPVGPVGSVGPMAPVGPMGPPVFHPKNGHFNPRARDGSGPAGMRRHGGAASGNGSSGPNGAAVGARGVNGGPSGGAKSPAARMLEELKTVKDHGYTLKDLYGHVLEFSSDQYGSRFIQKEMESATAEEKEEVFAELKTNAYQLMTSVFGNYVIQKFFELGTDEHRAELVQRMKGNVLPLSLHMYGCRVVQRAIEHVSLDEKISMVSELKGHVLECVKDQNGNHVIQKAVELIPLESIRFIVDCFVEPKKSGEVKPVRNGVAPSKGRGGVPGDASQIYVLSIHSYGCRIVQRLLEYVKNNSSDQKYILEEVYKNSYNLILNQYGNYVIQHIIQHKSSSSAGNRAAKENEEDQVLVYKDRIISLVADNILSFSKHKFASNVVEKCIVYGSIEQRKKITNTVLGADPATGQLTIEELAAMDGPKLQEYTASAAPIPLSEMIKDQYANYVIQKLLDVSKGPEKKVLVMFIRPSLNSLKRTSGAKRLASIERLISISEEVLGEKMTLK